jgi:hypothetical protein
MLLPILAGYVPMLSRGKDIPREGLRVLPESEYG